MKQSRKMEGWAEQGLVTRLLSYFFTQCLPDVLGIIFSHRLQEGFQRTSFSFKWAGIWTFFSYCSLGVASSMQELEPLKHPEESYNSWQVNVCCMFLGRKQNWVFWGFENYGTVRKTEIVIMPDTEPNPFIPNMPQTNSSVLPGARFCTVCFY